MGVVERQPLRLDVAFAGTEGEPGVAVRQRRRQHAMRLLVAVAHEETVVLRERVIDFRVHLVVLPVERRVDQVIVDDLPGAADDAPRVRLGNQLRQDVLRDRIPHALRDDVAGERRVRHRVVDDAVDLREVARAHLGRRHRREVRLPLRDAQPLVVEEEERLVLDDRAAVGAAEHMLAEGRLLASGAVVEEVVRVEPVVAQELERAAVVGVRSRLDLQVDDAAERVAEFGGVRARLHLELVERVDAREEHDRLQPRLVVVDAVEHVAVVARALSVGRERRRRAPRQAARAVDVRARNPADHARDGARQIDEVAPVQRQRLDLLLLHRRAELRR